KIYDRTLLAAHRDQLLPQLNDKHRHIFSLIMDACFNNKQQLVFVYGHGVYGHGGTGKTFLWKTIIFSLHSEGKIVLAVASSGIASMLLPAGRTAHSRFKIPLDLTDNTGTPIQANMDVKDIAYFDRLLQLHKAYRISGFSCEQTCLWERTLDNPTSLIFDRFIQLEEVPEEDFPEHYVNFASYNELAARADVKNAILTVAIPSVLPFGMTWPSTSTYKNTKH
nr:DNA helicase [Tanacetum cinerariifolium]